MFVVCVNLQGLFIFCFHCVRNTTVRSEWMSVVSAIHTRRTAHGSADSDLATDSSTRVSSFFTAHQHIIGHFSATKRTTSSTSCTDDVRPQDNGVRRRQFPTVIIVSSEAIVDSRRRPGALAVDERRLQNTDVHDQHLEHRRGRVQSKY